MSNKTILAESYNIIYSIIFLVSSQVYWQSYNSNYAQHFVFEIYSWHSLLFIKSSTDGLRRQVENLKHEKSVIVYQVWFFFVCMRRKTCNLYAIMSNYLCCFHFYDRFTFCWFSTNMMRTVRSKYTVSYLKRSFNDIKLLINSSSKSIYHGAESSKFKSNCIFCCKATLFPFPFF